MSKDYLYPLRVLHGKLYERRLLRKKQRELYNRFLVPFFDLKRKGEECVFLIMTPEHGNIGDQAIAYAEIKMLQKLGIKHIEISEYQLREIQTAKYLKMFNGHSILLQGGGYLGTIWFGVEELLRDLIVANPKSNIFMFPNTIYYEDSDWGQAELSASIAVYNRHKHLYLNAREKVSYNIMKDIYTRVKLYPDIVLSLENYESKCKRNGCLLCLRNDREKTRSQEEDTVLLEQVKCLFGDRVIHTDMCVPYSVFMQTRKEEIIKKFEEFCGAELVITDRLHAMIFCAITNTPCIVINSQSPKVKGCYEWIKQCEFIRFADDVSGISELYQIVSTVKRQYSNGSLIVYYDELMDDISTVFKKRK